MKDSAHHRQYIVIPLITNVILLNLIKAIKIKHALELELKHALKHDKSH
jgi:hypothetical protein